MFGYQGKIGVMRHDDGPPGTGRNDRRPVEEGWNELCRVSEHIRRVHAFNQCSGPRTPHGQDSDRLAERNWSWIERSRSAHDVVFGCPVENAPGGQNASTSPRGVEGTDLRGCCQDRWRQGIAEIVRGEPERWHGITHARGKPRRGVGIAVGHTELDAHQTCPTPDVHSSEANRSGFRLGATVGEPCSGTSSAISRGNVDTRDEPNTADVIVTEDCAPLADRLFPDLRRREAGLKPKKGLESGEAAFGVILKI